MSSLLSFIRKAVKRNAVNPAVQQNSYVYSKLEPAFPIPAQAKEKKVRKKYIKYSLPGVCEERGIPNEFMNQIKANGWKKADQMGLMTEFIKDGKLIKLMSQTNVFILIKV